jgi:hypothetical protein
LKRRNAASYSTRFNKWINVLVDGECRHFAFRHRLKLGFGQGAGALCVVAAAYFVVSSANDPTSDLTAIGSLALIMAVAWLALTASSTWTLWTEQSTTFPVRLSLFGVFIHTFLCATWMCAYPFIDHTLNSGDGYVASLVLAFVIIAALYTVVIVVPFMLWRVQFRAEREEHLYRFLVTLRRIESALKTAGDGPETYRSRSLDLALGSLRDQFVEIISGSTFRVYVALQPEQLPGAQKSAAERAQEHQTVFGAHRARYVGAILDRELDRHSPLRKRALRARTLLDALAPGMHVPPKAGRFDWLSVQARSESDQRLNQWRDRVVSALSSDLKQRESDTSAYATLIKGLIEGDDPTADPPTGNQPPRRWRDDLERGLDRALSPAAGGLAEMAQAESLRTLASADYRYRVMYWIGRLLTTWTKDHDWKQGLFYEAKLETEKNLTRVDRNSTLVAVVAAVISTLLGLGMTVANTILSKSSVAIGKFFVELFR